MAERPRHPRDVSKIPNTLERRATLIVDMLEDKAQHIVDSMDEPPPGTTEPDAATVRAMWSFSPFGDRAPQTFWMLHDLAVEKLLGEVGKSGLQGDAKLKAIRAAQQQAEAAALSRVYPHRASLMLLGITTPERSVELAEHAARIVDQEQKRTASRPEPEPAGVY